MKRILFIVIICFSAVQSINAQDASFEEANKKAKEWFAAARFGLFIHWGPFSIPGSGEWVMNERKITVKNYTRLMDFFNPVDFNAA